MKRAEEALYLLMAFYFAFASLFTVWKHYLFHSAGWDLGLYTNVMYNIIHGKIGFYSYELTINPSGNFFFLHFSPILFLIAPLFALFPRPETLLVIQSAVLALGALPLFHLAKRVLGSEWRALAVAGLYLTNPFLFGINYFDFHPEAFLPLGFILLFYAIHEKRIKLFYFAAAWTLISIEDAPLILIFALLPLLLKRGLPRRHILLALAFSAAYMISVGSWMASNAPYLVPFRYRFWDIWGSSPREILYNLATHPGAALERALGNFGVWEFIIVFLLSTGTLPLFAPSYFFSAIIFFGGALVSSPWSNFLTNIPYQYNAFFIGQAFVAMIFGLKNVSGLSRSKESVVLAKALVIAFIFTALLGAAFMVRHGDDYFRAPTSRELCLHEILSLIPENLSVMTQNRYQPHVSARSFVYGSELPRGIAPDVLIIDYKAYLDLVGHITKGENGTIIDNLNYLLANFNYIERFNQDFIVVYTLPHINLPELKCF